MSNTTNTTNQDWDSDTWWFDCHICDTPSLISPSTPYGTCQCS